MLHTNINYLDYELEAPDNQPNTFGISAPLLEENGHTFTVHVTLGTVQICVGQAVGDNSPVHEVDSKFVMTNVRKRVIHYTASAGAKFIIGY